MTSGPVGQPLARCKAKGVRPAGAGLVTLNRFKGVTG
jgi:hypothetical protein